MNVKKLNLKQGVASLVVLSVVSLLVIVLPLTTKLVLQNQENRSQAAPLTCSTVKDRGNRYCKSNTQPCVCFVSTDKDGKVVNAYWNCVTCPSGQKCGSKGCEKDTSVKPTNTPVPQCTTANYPQKCSGTNRTSCVSGKKVSKYCPYGCSGNDCADCNSTGGCASNQTCQNGKCFNKTIPKTCTYEGKTYDIGKVICQNNRPAECQSNGNWKTFNPCPHGCHGNGICNSAPTPTPTKPSCTNDKGGSCLTVNIATCQMEGGSVISGTDCPSSKICCKFSDSTTNISVSPSQSIIPTSLSLTPTNLSLQINQKQKISVKFFPDNVTNKSVVWSSNLTPIATVDVNGIVTGISPGNALIEVSLVANPKVKNHLNIKVVKAEPTNFCIPKTEVNCLDGRLYHCNSDGTDWEKINYSTCATGACKDTKSCSQTQTEGQNCTSEYKQCSGIGVAWYCNSSNKIAKDDCAAKNQDCQNGKCLTKCSESNCHLCSSLECHKTNGCFWTTDNDCQSIKSKLIPCTSRTYSDWSPCLNGQMKRKHIGYLPVGCRLTDGKPEDEIVLSRSCCQPGSYSCDGRNLMVCKSNGLDKELFQECGIDQTCNAINKTCDQKVSVSCTSDLKGKCISAAEVANCLSNKGKIVVANDCMGNTPNCCVYSFDSFCTTNGGVKVNQGKYVCDASDNNKRKICAHTSVSDLTLILKNSPCQTGYDCLPNDTTGADCLISCFKQQGKCIPATEILNCKMKEGTVLPNTSECRGYAAACCIDKQVNTCSASNCSACKRENCLGFENDCTWNFSDNYCQQNTKISSLIISPNRLTLDVNQSKTVQVTVLPETIINKPFTWKSDSQDIAIVDAKGTITGIKPGTVAISAISNNNSNIRGVVVVTVNTCNPKADNNKDGQIDFLDELICSSQDGVCHPDYHLKTLKEPPLDKFACLVGSVRWNNKEGSAGEYLWDCIKSFSGQIASCKAYKEKGNFGSECKNDNDCLVNGLSKCLEGRCMTPGGCLAKINSTIKTWKGSICFNNKQYTCNNSNNNFEKYSITDCSLGCDQTEYKCAQEGFKCSICGGIIFNIGAQSCSRYYKDGKEVEAINCQYECNQTSGRCNPNPNSNSKTPLCDAVKGICFGNIKTCQNEAGVVINNTDCPSPQVCCKFDTNKEKTGCTSTHNRKYQNGQIACVVDQNIDIEGAREGDTAAKCNDGRLSYIFCLNGCYKGICLKTKNETCRFNFECKTGICSQGICQLKPESALCEKNEECQSSNCPYGICLKPGNQCDSKWLKTNDWYWGCTEGQSCRGGKCINDGKCGLANQKDGRTFSSPPTTADNLCKYGKPTGVKIEKDTYSWQCLGEGLSSKNDNCNAKKGEVNCDGLKEGSKKCASKEILLTCTKDGWNPTSCDRGSDESDHLCIVDTCHAISFDTSPTKEGDICYPERNYRCPVGLECDPIINRCFKKDKLEDKKTLEPCKGINYGGSIVYDINACPEGSSCNRRTEKCEPTASTIKHYLRANDICSYDYQCISGFCQPTGSSLSICSDVDEKAYIDKGNKNTAIILGTALGAPVLSAGGLAMYSALSGLAINVQSAALCYPVMTKLVSMGASSLMVFNFFNGVKDCINNPYSPECDQAKVILSSPDYTKLLYNAEHNLTDMFDDLNKSLSNVFKTTTNDYGLPLGFTEITTDNVPNYATVYSGNDNLVTDAGIIKSVTSNLELALTGGKVNSANLSEALGMPTGSIYNKFSVDPNLGMNLSALAFPIIEYSRGANVASLAGMNFNITPNGIGATFVNSKLYKGMKNAGNSDTIKMVEEIQKDIGTLKLVEEVLVEYPEMRYIGRGMFGITFADDKSGLLIKIDRKNSLVYDQRDTSFQRKLYLKYPNELGGVYIPGIGDYEEIAIQKFIPNAIPLRDYRGKLTSQEIDEAYTRFVELQRVTGIPHGDLHPGNILVQNKNGKMEIHAIDYGGFQVDRFNNLNFVQSLISYEQNKFRKMLEIYKGP